MVVRVHQDLFKASFKVIRFPSHLLKPICNMQSPSLDHDISLVEEALINL